MNLIVWILLGELALVSIVGVIVAVTLAKIRENRLISALHDLAAGIKSNEFEHREELNYLSTELLGLGAGDAKTIADQVMADEKRIISLLARVLAERDLDGLSDFHHQISDLSALQLKATGNALRNSRMATTQYEDASQNQNMHAETPAADDAPAVVQEEIATSTKADDPLPLLTPEELEQEIWGELEKISEDVPETASAIQDENIAAPGEANDALSVDDLLARTFDQPPNALEETEPTEPDNESKEEELAEDIPESPPSSNEEHLSAPEEAENAFSVDDLLARTFDQAPSVLEVTSDLIDSEEPTPSNDTEIAQTADISQAEEAIDTIAEHEAPEPVEPARKPLDEIPAGETIDQDSVETEFLALDVGDSGANLDEAPTSREPLTEPDETPLDSEPSTDLEPEFPGAGPATLEAAETLDGESQTATAPLPDPPNVLDEAATTAAGSDEPGKTKVNKKKKRRKKQGRSAPGGNEEAQPTSGDDTGDDE